MKNGLHVVVCTDLVNSDLVLQDPAGVTNMIPQVLCAVSVRADRDDPAAEISVQLQDRP